MSDLRAAAEGLLKIINAAGLLNLSNGVQLGQTVWYVKATDAVERLQRALAEPDARTVGYRAGIEAAARWHKAEADRLRALLPEEARHD